MTTFYLEKNEIANFDHLIWNIDYFSENYSYYDVLNYKAETSSRNGLYEVTFSLSAQMTSHSREAYTFLDLIGDVGGFFDGLVIIVSFFI